MHQLRVSKQVEEYIALLRQSPPGLPPQTVTRMHPMLVNQQLPAGLVLRPVLLNHTRFVNPNTRVLSYSQALPAYCFAIPQLAKAEDGSRDYYGATLV